MGEAKEVLLLAGGLNRFPAKDEKKKGTVLSKTKYKALLLFFACSTKGVLAISSCKEQVKLFFTSAVGLFDLEEEASMSIETTLNSSF